MLIAAFLLLATPRAGQAAGHRGESPPVETCDLLGLWRADEGEGSVRFRREGEVIVGRVVEPPRDGVAVGFAFLYELRWVKEEGRYEGWLARSEDSIIRAEITCSSPEAIVVRGRMGFLGRSFGWTRVAAEGGR